MSTKELFLFFVIMVVRYAVIAGIAFLVFYVFFRKKFFRRKIQKLFPSNKDYTREIIYSLLTVLIFTGIAFLLESRYVKPHTRIYAHINDYGLLYFICSIPLALVIHDTYFYWTHRLMHHPGLFKLFHLTHHKFTNPSPWAAYAFNPFEAVVEGSVIFVIAFLIPIHDFAILFFLLIMLTYNVYGHIGYEIYPQWVVKSKLGKWLNTSTNHNMHHKYFKGNYGLYFRIWDEIMKTTHPDYERTLNEVTKSQRESVTQSGNLI